MKRQEIESILKDYHWMMNSIKLLRASMEDAGENLVKKYGDDSDMPKAKGGTSDPVYQEVKRREKRWGVVYKYEQKVQSIQIRMHLITIEREVEVLHWMLEGKSLRWIAIHMGLSHSHVQRIKNSIVDTFINVPNVPEVTELKKEKTLV